MKRRSLKRALAVIVGITLFVFFMDLLVKWFCIAFLAIMHYPLQSMIIVLSLSLLGMVANLVYLKITNKI